MGTPREIAQIAVFHLDGQQPLIEVAPGAQHGIRILTDIELLDELRKE